MPLAIFPSKKDECLKNRSPLISSAHKKKQKMPRVREFSLNWRYTLMSKR